MVESLGRGGEVALERGERERERSTYYIVQREREREVHRKHSMNRTGHIMRSPAHVQNM